MNIISVDGKSFVDELGRERIFRGMNFVYKGTKDSYPRSYIPDWDDDALEKMQTNGFNLIRLGLIWDGIEHEMGRYDDEYLGYMAAFVDRCAKHGIHVYIDMHQDLYASFSIPSGDGAPLWATLTDGRVYHHLSGEVWSAGYFLSSAIHRAFDSFWSNKPVAGRGLQDRYTDMWKHTAEFFKDKPALFGFDLMNEPFPGTDGGAVFRKLIYGALAAVAKNNAIGKSDLIKSLLSQKKRYDLIALFNDESTYRKIIKNGNSLIKRFDIEKYYPFFRKTATAVREVTEKGIILMENCYYSNIAIPCSTPRLEYRGGKKEKNFAFAPHGYDLIVDTTADEETADNMRVDVIFEEHRNTQNRLGCPVLVGEWGGHSGKDEGLWHIEHLLDIFEKNRWSTTYWCYQNGIFETPLMKTLVRPYPQAVTGTIDSFSFDPKTRTFSLTYSQKREYACETVIFVPSEPKSIKTDGEYAVDGKLLKIKTGIGIHTVTLKL